MRVCGFVSVRCLWTLFSQASNQLLALHSHFMIDDSENMMNPIAPDLAGWCASEVRVPCAESRPHATPCAPRLMAWLEDWRAAAARPPWLDSGMYGTFDSPRNV